MAYPKRKLYPNFRLSGLGDDTVDVSTDDTTDYESENADNTIAPPVVDQQLYQQSEASQNSGSSFSLTSALNSLTQTALAAKAIETVVNPTTTTAAAPGAAKPGAANPALPGASTGLSTGMKIGLGVVAALLATGVVVAIVESTKKKKAA